MLFERFVASACSALLIFAHFRFLLPFIHTYSETTHTHAPSEYSIAQLYTYLIRSFLPPSPLKLSHLLRLRALT
jgi:hypothetical protein